MNLLLRSDSRPCLVWRVWYGIQSYMCAKFQMDWSSRSVANRRWQTDKQTGFNFFIQMYGNLKKNTTITCQVIRISSSWSNYKKAFFNLEKLLKTGSWLCCGENKCRCPAWSPNTSAWLVAETSITLHKELWVSTCKYYKSCWLCMEPMWLLD